MRQTTARHDYVNGALTAQSRVCCPLRRDHARGWRQTLEFVRDDRGSATAEYAVATMAAVGFAGLLVVLLRGDEVRSILTDLVKRALSAAG